jgi:GAF domain-containing protein
MPGGRVYVRTLERALRIIGSEEALADLLWVRPATLGRYLRGEARPPDDVFLKAVDILFNDSWAAQRNASQAELFAKRRERTLNVARATTQLLSAAEITLEETKALCDEAALVREASKASGLKHRLFDPEYRPKDRQDLLETGLDAGLQAVSTDRGDIELADARGALHIEAWRGFSAEFLQFFDGGADPRSACALAFAQHKQVVIADVRSDPLYLGTALLEVLRAADVRAICATPMVTPAGETLGILSTHFHEAKAPAEDECACLTLVARGTAAWLSSIAVA